MADQIDIVAGHADLGGTMRLGSYPAILADGYSPRGPTSVLRRCPSGIGTGTRSTTLIATDSRTRAL